MSANALPNNTSDEIAELERVLTRLGSINDDARLEQVLQGLLPKLLERFETCVDAKAKAILIEIFNHVTQWIKSPSKVKLPILAIASVVASKCSKDSPALRVALMLIELGFDRGTDDEKIECTKALLRVAGSKIVDSQPSFAKLFGATMLQLNVDAIEGNLTWVLDFCMDCCCPQSNYFPVDSIRSLRLQSPNLARNSRTIDDNSNRAKDCLTLLIGLCERDSSRGEGSIVGVKDKAYTPALISSVTCATSTQFRDDVRSLGEESIRRLRDFKRSNSNNNREEELNALFDLVLGSTERPKVANARNKALDLIGRFISSLDSTTTSSLPPKMCDRLVKIFISGMFSTDPAISLRLATLDLLTQIAPHFPSGIPAEAFIFNAMKQQLPFIQTALEANNSDASPAANHEFREHYFRAFCSWSLSRPSEEFASLVDLAIVQRLCKVLSLESNVEAGQSEYHCICALKDIASEVNSRVKYDWLASLVEGTDWFLEAIEFSTTPSSTKLKMFALSIANALLHENVANSAVRVNAAQVATESAWIVILSSRGLETRELRLLALRSMRLLSSSPEKTSSVQTFHSLVSFNSFMSFLKTRETIWASKTKEAPRDYFFPNCLYVLKPRIALESGEKSDAVGQFIQSRLGSGLCYFPQEAAFDVRTVSAECLLECLKHDFISINQIDSLFEHSGTVLTPIQWILKYLSSSSEALRRSCAKLCEHFYLRWAEQTNEYIVSKLAQNTCWFNECHGSICAIAYIPVTTSSQSLLVQSLFDWLLRSGNESNNQNPHLRNECFATLKSILMSNFDLLVGQFPMKELLEKVQYFIKNKSPTDDLEGIILFLGALLSQSTQRAAAATLLPSDGQSTMMDQANLAFKLLLDLSSDSRFGLGSQIVVGKSLSQLTEQTKLEQCIQEILDKSVFSEASQKSRSSAAVILEQVLLGQTKLNLSLPVLDDLEEGLIDLLAEPEEHTRLCACRALAQLYFSTSSQNITVKDRVSSTLMRRLLLIGSSLSIGGQQSTSASAVATPSSSSRPNTVSTATSSETETMNQDGRNTRRPRLARARRGNEERFWPFQDLAQAAQQSGNASLIFHFFRLCGREQSTATPGAAAETSSSEKILSVDDIEQETVHLAQDNELLQILQSCSLARLATQFMRRRHFPVEELGYKAASRVWQLRLAGEKIHENNSIASAVWKECARLLRDSFLAKDRRSACLTLTEIASKFPDHQGTEFISSLEDAWRLVFRALDDLDEQISSGPALAFGRAMKRRTLIALLTVTNSNEETTSASSSQAEVEEVSSMFTYLLDLGLAHPSKPARDLTRSFLVDSISQRKLPDKFVVRVVEALLRTIGESESLALQYAQFHARGNGGTAVLNVDAHKLEEARARLALESPEYQAALRCASRIESISTSQELVQAVARVVRTGVGLVTLVAATSLAGFLASDEWKMARQVLTEDETLMRALSQKFANDPSVELKRRIASNAACVARYASKQTVAEYCLTISQSYDADPETPHMSRLLAAQACVDLVRRLILHANLIRPSFLGRFGEEKDVSELWKQAWEGGLGAASTEEELIAICHKGINEYSYRTRRQAAEGLMSLPRFTIEKACHGQLGVDLIKMSTGSSVWEGKEILCKAAGGVFAVSSDPDLTEYASTEFQSALFQYRAEEDKATPRPKWLWESLFEAQRQIFTNPLLASRAKQRFMKEWSANFANLPKEPVVVAASLICAKEASKSLSRVTDEGDLLTLVLQKVLDLLDTVPTWNVKVAALELLNETMPGALRDTTKTSQEELLLRHLEKYLTEEKKPTVLVACLVLTKSILSLGSTKLSIASTSTAHSWFIGSIRPLLVRLETNSDPTVGKLANEAKSLC